jgi:hypothetical protein
MQNAEELNLVRSILDENSCNILVKNNETLFIFWKFSQFKINQFINLEYKEKILIRLYDSSERQMLEIESKWNSGKIYIKLPKQGFICKARIYSFKGDALEELFSSQYVRVPIGEVNAISSYEFIGISK